MPLHPRIAAYLAEVEKANLPDISTLSPREARRRVAPCAEPLDAVETVADFRIPAAGREIPVRQYIPVGWATSPRAGTLVYLHGGGWVQANVECYDNLCRTLANASGWRIVSVEYRLAPEHPFPAGLEDTYETLCWLAQEPVLGGGAARMLAVGGDSAGGNLAAAATLVARDRQGPKLAGQLLIYPVTDFSFDTPSYRENATGLLLTRAGMEWCWKHYLQDPSQGTDPYVSPLRANDFSQLPPAVVLTAEYDPLRDEGRAYAERLREAGVPVQQIHLADNIHGLLRHTQVFPESRDILIQLGEAFRDHLAGAGGS